MIREFGARLGNPGVNAFPIRMLAVVFMIVDHFAAALVGTAILPKLIDPTLVYRQDWLMFYHVLRDFGRFTFPIFCFFICEGVRHTGNVKKYAIRLLIFGLISEIPFDMAIKGGFFNFSRSNTFFTLLLGMLMLYVIEQSFTRRISGQGEDAKPLFPLGRNAGDARAGRDLSLPTRLDALIVVVVTGACFLAAWLIKSDYSVKGMALILAMYICEELGRRIPGRMLFGQHLFTALSGVCFIILEAHTWVISIPAVLMFFLIVSYNGERGRKLKWFFYFVYPIHLLVFGVLRMAFA